MLLDGHKADIPSIRVKPGQVISLKDNFKDLQIVKDNLEATLARQPYIDFNADKLEAKYVRLPEREEFLTDIKENLIVEFYNR